MKETLKQAFIKAFYIIFALLVSIALWMFVEITDNVLLTREVPIREDQILLKNRELLGSRELLVSSILTQNLVLTYEGTRTEISRLASVADDVMIEIDLGDIRSAGSVSLNYDEILPESLQNTGLSIKSRSTSQVVVVIDRHLKREFSVKASYSGGTASEEYVPEEPIVDPQVISVSGPEEIVSQIAHVFVPIRAENLSSTYEDYLDFVLINENGEDLNADLHISDALTFSHESIRVIVPVKQLKVIPLQVIFAHGATTSDANTTWSIEPREITVSFEPGTSDVNSLILGTIDMTSFTLATATPRTFPIILPDGMESISNESEATVMVEVLNLAITYHSVSNLQVDNIPVGYTVNIITQTLDIRVRGTQANLAQISADNIMVVADLSEISTAGNHRVSARVQLIGTTLPIDIIGDYIMTVTLTSDT